MAVLATFAAAECGGGGSGSVWEGNIQYSFSFVGWHLQLPWWSPLLVSFLAVALLIPIWLVDRRPFSAGHCAGCGYDLRATPDRCPECGTVPAKRE